ncbi:MAG: glycoside hydrolase family protein [Planctomycetes bacterium]|nr:glycoside hydrolase family protein [Planctomycetota bacterium]
MHACALELRPANRAAGFRMAGWWVWCGAAAQGDDGTWHLFASRWPRRLPFFRGYVVASEVVRAVADRPEGPYRFAEVVLPARGAGSWDGRMTHNPTLLRWGGKWYLYYIGATYAGAVPDAAALTAGTPVVDQAYATVRIGVMEADRLEGPWRRLDYPVLQPQAGAWDASVVTNPAPCLARDGSVLLYYRSNTPQGLRIGLATAPTPLGPFTRAGDRPVLDLPDGNHVEDPFVWWDGTRYRMIAKDMTGGITGERHAGAHLVSSDGRTWTVGAPARAYSRQVDWDDGSSSRLGCLERPYLLFDADGRPSHLLGATADGPGGFDHASETWNAVLPLV